MLSELRVVVGDDLCSLGPKGVQLDHDLLQRSLFDRIHFLDCELQRSLVTLHEGAKDLCHEVFDERIVATHVEQTAQRAA